VTVENHPGAGSMAAPALVAKSSADGYTLLVNTSAQAFTAVLVKNLPYDPLKDFTTVAPLTGQPYVLVSGTSSGITTGRELIAAAKAKPGGLKFGSIGIGTGSHLGLEEFNLQAGITVVHVPPRPGEVIADVIANAAARQYDLHDGAHLARAGRYPCRQAPCSGRPHRSARPYWVPQRP